MKYIILLLITFNSYADVKMSFVLSNGKISSPTFKTTTEAQINFDDNKDNKSWGYRDHWKKRELSETCSGIERQLGGIVEGFTYECFFPSNYTVCGQNPDQLDIALHCEDITAEVKAKKDKKDADDLTMESLRAKLLDGTIKYDEMIIYTRIKDGIL